jgi:S-(hydroxymethyl)glutathione dehydrogenase/alcohol dehydrogenase
MSAFGAVSDTVVADRVHSLAMRMQAAVLEEFGAPLVVQDVDLADPRAGEVLVRLEACGVCHTDLYTASGADPSGYSPTVLGHEGAGVVERVGEGVTMVQPGDHVVTLFSPQCGECVHCLSPRTNLCLAIRDMQGQGYLPDGTTRLSRGGEPIRHFMGTSTFAEYTVMPQIALAKINPEAPLDRACLFACGLSTGLGAAMNTAAVQPGSTCVVFGAGMVGLGAVAGCRLQGAERIVCVDMSAERLELARGQGATDVMIGGPETVAAILEMTGGFGADYTFEATGNVAVMRQAVEAARMGWGLATVAGVAGKGETLDIVPRLLITGRRVAGSSFGGVKGRVGVPALIERSLAGDIDVDPFVSHHLKLADVNRGFELMEAQDGIRSVIHFS